MILPHSRPIRLDRLATAVLSMVELDYADVSSPFDDPNVLDDAVQSFVSHVDDNHDDEPALRDALSWVLNLPPERFEPVLARLKVPYPHQRDPGEIRRLLELLWQRTFGDWTVRGFDPDAYEVRMP